MPQAKKFSWNRAPHPKQIHHQRTTILTGRGMGIHEKARVLGKPIERKKDIALILILQALTEQVLESITRGVDLEKPGRGR